AGVGEGKLDTGGGEFSVADDDAHIVQHGAGPEDGVEEFRGQDGVDECAGLGETAEADFAFDGDECADLVFRTIGGGANDGVDGGFQGRADGPEEACFAEACKGAAEFGLEDDDGGKGGKDKEAGIEEFDTAQLVAAKLDDDVGDDEEEGHALNEACAACSAEE